MKVHTVYNNFARGEIDHDMNGRFDLPIYNSGSDRFRNFESNIKGNAIYRNGFENLLSFQDCALLPFKFNKEQNYIIVAYNTKFRYLTYDSSNNFGWVESGGSPVETTTPYSLADAKQLDISQNADVCYICNNSYFPRKLTRTSATSFSIATPSISGDPFTSGSNFPSCSTFYKGRLYYGDPANEVTKVYASEVASYDNLTTGTDPADPLELELTDISEPIEWLFAGENSLIVGASDGIVSINGGSIGEPIDVDNVEASLSSADGCNSVKPRARDGFVFYVDKQGRRTLAFRYDLLTESFKAEDLNKINYDITQSGIKRVEVLRDKYKRLYMLLNSGELLSLVFDDGEKVVSWARHSTKGTIQDIVVISDNNGEDYLHALVKIGTVYYIERLSKEVEFARRDDFYTDEGSSEADNYAYNTLVGEQLRSCVYVDNALIVNDLQESNTITYDSVAGTITANSSVFDSGDVGKHITYKTSTGYEYGKFEITGYTSGTVVDVDVLIEPSDDSYDDWYLSFSSLTGLSQYNGETVAVIADGGYLSDFTISDGEIADLGRQCSSIVVGYKYIGFIKSFSLGFQAQGQNTQSTQKGISRIGVRTVDSAGLQAGTSRYRLEPIQQLKQGDLNYLPPQIMDGTKYVSIVDDMDRDKYLYIVQDKPLPAKITAVLLETKY